MWFLLAAGLAGCGDPGVAMKPEEYNTVPVRLPNGRILRAEQMVQPEEILRGMKYRDDLSADRGMLFYHDKPGYYSYWMHEVKVPLDIIWLDAQKRVVQVVHGAPPCPGPQEKCPGYGGGFEAKYVLEVRAGVAKECGVRPGTQIDF